MASSSTPTLILPSAAELTRLVEAKRRARQHEVGGFEKVGPGAAADWKKLARGPSPGVSALSLRSARTPRD